MRVGDVGNGGSATGEGSTGWRSPFDEHLGVVFEQVAADHSTCRLPVARHLLQPEGIVHGGVYASLVEVAASLAATTWLDGRGVAVGVSNHTDFLHAVGAGHLLARSRPLQRGQRLQLWQVAVTDADERLVAQGTVRFVNLPPR